MDTSKDSPKEEVKYAHTHKRIDEDGKETFDSCPIVKYKVRSEVGLTVNEILYTGEVKVAQCVANYLNELDQAHAQSEESIYRNRGRQAVVGAYRG